MGRPKKVKDEQKTTGAKIATVQTAARGKDQDKNIREPVGIENDVNKLSQADKVRMATGKQKRLDLSFYNRLPEYEGKTLFWEEDLHGAVERWLHIGAALVPRKSQSMQHFKGFTDSTENEWVRVPVGSDETGKTLYNYAMFLPTDEYNSLRVAPKEERNREVLEALGAGKSQTEERVMPGVSGIRTYAPNNPSGTGQGFEQTHDA